MVKIRAGILHARMGIMAAKTRHTNRGWWGFAATKGFYWGTITRWIGKDLWISDSIWNNPKLLLYNQIEHD